jgi:hypothetical protein
MIVRVRRVYQVNAASSCPCRQDRLRCALFVRRRLPMKPMCVVLSLAFFTASAADAAQRGPNVTCESYNESRMLCDVPGDGRVWVDMLLSETPCIEGDTWERTSTGILVDKGCRAIFATTLAEPEPPNRNTYIDLIGATADSARVTLAERGYAFIGSGREEDGRQPRYFRAPDGRGCLRVVERNGHYDDVGGVEARQCDRL